MKPFAARLLFHPGTMTSGIITLNLLNNREKKNTCCLLRPSLAYHLVQILYSNYQKKIHLKKKNMNNLPPPTPTPTFWEKSK